MTKILIRASLRNKLGNKFDAYMHTLHKFMENPQAHGLNLEKLHGPAGGQRTYSIRHTKKSRIILCPIESKEGQVWVVTDVLPDHEYDALTPLSDAEKKVLLASLTIASSVNNNNNNNNAAAGTLIRETNNIEFCNNQFILLDDEQVDARTKGVTSLPLIISGAPGSGKTSVLLSIVKQNIVMHDQGDNSPRILIIAKSANLIQQLQKEWISICNVEFKDMNIDINCVEFTTPEEIYIQQHGVTNFKGEQDFISWYSHYATTQNKLNKGDTLLVSVEEAHLIYQEFYTMSGYQSFDEYDAVVSSKFSLFSDRQTRAWLWQLYEAYKKKLADDKEVDLAFQPIELSQTYQFIGVDETQDLSRQQIRSLAHQKEGESIQDNLIFCVGDHQRLFGSETTLPFLRSIFWEKYQKDVTTHKVLHASYRCPQAVIEVANAVLQLKSRVTGDFDKNDIPRVRALHESDQAGSVHWLEKEDELAPMINDRNNAHFVVITSPEFMDEAARLFGPERVFTASGMKGLQAKHVLLYRFLDQEGFKAANPIIGDDFHLQDTSAGKTADRSIRHSTIFNEFFVATTRAEVSLSIYQPPVRSIRFLCEPLKGFIVEHNKGKSHAQSTPTNSTSEEWQTLVDRLRAEGQHSQAQAIIDKHLTAGANQAGHSHSKNETAQENQNSNKKTRRKVHPIEEVLLDKPQAMEKLLNDINARDYLFNTPLNAINPAWPECSLMEYLNKPEQTKIKEQLLSTLVKNLSSVCNLKKPTRAQQDRQDALIGLLYHKSASTSLPLALLLLNKLTPEQRSFVKDYMQNRLKQLNEQLEKGDLDAVASLKYLGLVNTFNKEGLAPIHIAVKAGKTAIIDALKKAGADLDLLDKTGETALCRAAQLGQLKIITALLKSGADVNKANATGVCPLHFAVRNGNMLVIEKLLNHEGVDVNKQDIHGVTPLHVAALEPGSANKIKLLIRFGADLRITENGGSTALHFATINGLVDAIDTLIELGADINKSGNGGNTALHYAASEGNIELVHTLLSKNNIEIDKPDINGMTPLHVAALNGHANVIQALIKAGAQPNVVDKYGATPLYYATRPGHVAAIEVLLDAGAEVNITDTEGFSPLHVAIGSGHANVIKMLRKAGACLHILNNTGLTPLHYAAEMGSGKLIEALNPGVDINILSKDGITPLHSAAMNGRVAAIEALINAGADLSIVDDTGWSPLHYAAGNGHVKAIQALIKHGLTPKVIDNDGSTPLHIAAFDGFVEAIEALIKAGAEVNSVDNNGWTPLHFASQYGHTEAVQALIKAGAEINSVDNNGRSPLHVAAEKGRIKIMHALLAFGANLHVANNRGLTPLHMAAVNGQKNSVITLVEDYGADVNKVGNDGETPLLMAVYEGDLDIVTYLVNANASCSGTYRFTKSNLLACAITGDVIGASTRAEEYMTSKGLAVDCQDVMHLHLHEIAHILGHKEIEELILDKLALSKNAGNRHGFFNNNNNITTADSSSIDLSSGPESRAAVSPGRSLAGARDDGAPGL